MMLKTLRTTLLLPVVVLSACGTDLLVSTAETADALEAAQCDFGRFGEAAAACRATYEACKAAEGADLTACREALRASLPPPPEGRPPRGADGGCRAGEGGERPPHPEGLAGLDGGRPPHPPGHHRGPRGPHPDRAAVEACRTAFDACIAANPDDATCQETERSCVHAAFEAAFQATCEEASARCATESSDACTRILARCEAGLGGECVEGTTAVVE